MRETLPARPPPPPQTDTVMTRTKIRGHRGGENRLGEGGRRETRRSGDHEIDEGGRGRGGESTNDNERRRRNDDGE